MRIFINGNLVDFQIENEKTFSDLIVSVENWATSRGLVLCSSSADGTVYNSDEDTEISGIDKAEFVIQSKSDLIIDTLNEAAFYCDRITEISSSMELSPEQLSDVATGSAWLSDVLTRVTALLDVDPDSIVYNAKKGTDYIDLLKELSLSLKGSGAPDIMKNKREIYSETKNFTRLLLSCDQMRSIIVKSIDTPENLIAILQQIKSESTSKIALLEEISSRFQSGKDSDASTLLQEFVDYLFRFLRITTQLPAVFGISQDRIFPGGKNLFQFNEDINMVLNEIVSVMENNDIVSLSDILEYELKAQMQSVPEMLEELSKEINSLV